MEGMKRSEKAMAEERLRNAKAMKDDGLPIETIAKYTGLSQEDITSL